MASTKQSELRVLLEAVQAQLTGLAERVSQLESAVATRELRAEFPVPAHVAAASVSPAQPEHDADIPEEILLAISAAVAAFLGERAHVRQVRLIRSAAWSQQGRVSVQASHRLQR
jgi:methylmalonyl-CoA carboxyltransferase 12S subunit